MPWRSASSGAAASATRLGDPLRTTSLVHDTYLKLAASEGTPCRDREHFLAIAAKAMRWVLVDHARRFGANKRSANGERVELDAGVAKSDILPANLLAIDEALTRLAALDERRARIVELRFFGGLTVEETATILGISTPTVKRDWRLARAWLYREIHGR